MNATVPHPLIDATEVTLDSRAPAIRAVEMLDRAVAKIVLVVDKNGKLIGSVVDGDIRRALLKGCTLNSPVREVMHPDPYVLPVDAPRQRILEMMRTMGIRHIPLITDSGRIAGLVAYDELSGLKYPPRGNMVVIMAGGKGQRLLPLTSEIPKPMVDISGRPMLEWILQRFLQYGFSRFAIAINHLGHVIEEHFGDGAAFGCHIDYIREKEFLGTAGALSLLPVPTQPIMVINGDILSSIDFAELMNFHEEGKYAATICARTYRSEVPYGVIQAKNGLMQSIVEKPVYEDIISAGIYVLSPGALRHVPKNMPTDMPGVLQALVKDKQRVGIFSLQQEWVDVGRLDDLELAKRAFIEKAS